MEDETLVRKLLNAVPDRQTSGQSRRGIDVHEHLMKDMKAKENLLENMVGEDLTNHEAKKITDSDQKGRTRDWEDGNHHK
ncbi:hypothetical protein Tco_0896257 [Tanacetum coccineum]